MKINTDSGINTAPIKQEPQDWLKLVKNREVGALGVGFICSEARKALTESFLYFCNAFSMMRVMNPYCFHPFWPFWGRPQPKKQPSPHTSPTPSFPSPFLHVYQQ